MEAAVDNVLEILQQYHLLGMFIMLLACGLGFPMPEDVILVSAGILAQREGSSVWTSVALAYVGVLMGDSIMYYLGYRLGHRVFESKRLQFFLTQERKAKIERVFEKWGSFAIFFGRFAAGIRAGIFLMAGTTRLSYRRFFLFDSLAAILSVPMFIWLGFVFSKKANVLFEWIKTVKIYVGIASGIVVVLYLFYRFFLKNKWVKTTK